LIQAAEAEREAAIANDASNVLLALMEDMHPDDVITLSGLKREMDSKGVENDVQVERLKKLAEELDAKRELEEEARREAEEKKAEELETKELEAKRLLFEGQRRDGF
jgi:hypothetical protein